jgi:hypothetical protein
MGLIRGKFRAINFFSNPPKTATHIGYGKGLSILPLLK